MEFFRSVILVLFIAVSLPMMAAVEYDIVPLLPAEYLELESLKDTDYDSSITNLSDGGYVAFVLRTSDQGDLTFVYHPEHGITKIIGPLEDDSVFPEFVTKSGLVLNRNYNYEPWMEKNHFVFDAVNKKRIDLESVPLSLNDEGLILLKSDGDYDYNEAVILNIFTDEVIKQFDDMPMLINNKGGLVGKSWYYSEETGKINFDLQNEYIRPLFFNDEGAVFGTFGEEYTEQYFIWSPSEGMLVIEDLEDDDGALGVRVSSMNNLAQVVGVRDFSSKAHAFIFDRTTGIVDLGTLGGKKSKANDINDLGQVVGYSDTGGNEKGQRAFIWDQKRGMRDLQELIPQASGWTKLKVATDINNQGHIVGEGNYKGRKTHFMLIPK